MHRIIWMVIAVYGMGVCFARAENVVELDGGKCSIVDGNPFFAIGIYSAEINDFSMLVEAGFNTVHTYGWEGTSDNEKNRAWLDAAASHGLKALVGLYRPSVQAGDIESCAKRIQMYRDHSALLAWHIMDEPCWDEKGNVGKDYMPAVYRCIKNNDPHHPATAVVCHFRDNQLFENSVDVMQGDYYPIPPIPASNFSGTGFRGIKQYVDGWREASSGQKPFWFVCQAFDYSFLRGDVDIPEEWRRFPTLKELRTMTYVAVASGARGVLYWSLSRLRSEVRPGGTTAEDHWKCLATVVGELNELMPLLTADTQETIVDKNHVVAMIKSDGTDTYIIAANYERQPTQIVWTIPGVQTATAEVVFGEGSQEIEDGKLVVSLDSTETRVYRLAGQR